MLRIPTFFHELFGESQTILSMVLIACFVTLSALLLSLLYAPQLLALPLIKQLVLLLLYLDISGGVISNLTVGTDRYYNQRSKARRIFIAIHIQPLLLAWALEGSLSLAFILTAYTVSTAFLLNHHRHHTEHRVFCGMASALGLILAILEANPLLSSLYAFYVIKVLYNFSVYHERSQT